MDDDTDPEASEADALEQRQEVLGAGRSDRRPIAGREAAEADALEQAEELPEDEDDVR